MTVFASFQTGRIWRFISAWPHIFDNFRCEYCDMEIQIELFITYPLFALLKVGIKVIHKHSLISV